jgi:predicted ATPase/class 3 adenylate cyclase
VAVTSEFLTFLYTDLEGSTALWERRPDDMGRALARHDELLRHAITAHGGDVVKGTGDGMLAIFRSAREGVRAALDAQRALAGAEWPDGMTLRARMGLHVGEATERDGDWYGSEVNRVARVMSVAHGGQVVCTRIVEELACDEFDFVDLGEHRLRDVRNTVHLFQIEIPGAPAVHPPLESVDAQLTNLPYELSSFIGREREQAEVAARVRESRLVSIVGVGGVGKTRLALQVGAAAVAEHAGGVWLCELATVSDPADLHEAVAAALQYTPPLGVAASIGLRQHLERKRVLLILDNCEHLVAAVAAFVADITTHAPGVSVLATSREALGVSGEHIYPLPSLTLPDAADVDAVVNSEAGALFVARAREAGGDVTLDERTTTAISALCTRLDGIPLALELAAAQAGLMHPVEIERRLDRQFRAATGGRRGALERHQTLRGTIDWSYQLLTPAGRALLGRLSVCVGGFDHDAADALGADLDGDAADAFELVRELVAKSLVERYEAAETTRYRLLEMIRQYAAEQLDEPTASTTRDLHAKHYTGRLVELAGDATSDAEYEALDVLAIETPNISAGLEWLMASGRTADVLQSFEAMPYFDYFCAPPVMLDELTPIARAAIDAEGSERLPGFAQAAMFVCFRAFITGNIDDYRRMTARVSSGGDSVASGVIDSTLAMFDGDLPRAALRAVRASELAQDAEPQLAAWTLAHCAVMESLTEQWIDQAGPPVSRTHAEAAVALAQRIPGTLARLYPLLALATCCLGYDEDHVVAAAPGLAAADEVVGLDRTQRRWWSTMVASAAAHTRAALGQGLDDLADWRASLENYRQREEPFMFVMLLAYVCEALATEEPEAALDLAAIAESGAIAPTATMAVYPSLIRRVAESPDLAAAARARAAAMARDEAYDHVLACLDGYLTDRRPG